MRAFLSFVALAAAAAFTGCGGGYQPAPPVPQSAPPQAAAKPAQPVQPTQPAQQSGLTGGMAAMGGAIGMAPMETAVQGPAGVPPVNPAPAAATPTAPTPGPTYQPVEAGVGVKGSGYGGGVITEPIHQYFRAQERINFAQIKHELDLYKALNGSAPKTQEEYVEKILKPLQIKLPELPPGQRYVYDPAREELMVERPGP